MTDSEKYRKGKGEIEIQQGMLKRNWNLKSKSGWNFLKNNNVPFA